MTAYRSDQRLSKPFDGTTGCAPAIAVSRSFASGAGFVATFGSPFTGAGGFAAGTTGFGFGAAACLTGAGAVLAVVSEPPPIPILRARLEKKPSEPDDGAEATRTGELADGFAGSARAADAAAGDEGADEDM
jgi:hypothetical protein